MYVYESALKLTYKAYGTVYFSLRSSPHCPEMFSCVHQF
jgi:hypothetical protein